MHLLNNNNSIDHNTNLYRTQLQINNFHLNMKMLKVLSSAMNSEL